MTPALPELVALSELAVRLDRVAMELGHDDDLAKEIWSVRAQLLAIKYATQPARDSGLGEDARDAAEWRKYKALFPMAANFMEAASPLVLNKLKLQEAAVAALAIPSEGELK